MKYLLPIFIVVIGGIVAIIAVLQISNSLIISEARNQKIVDLQQQQLINGGKENVSTEIRYLIITDKETFICESSILNNKFDNSNIFWHLKRGKTYNFRVQGQGKSFLYDYRNVLDTIR